MLLFEISLAEGGAAELATLSGRSRYINTCRYLYIYSYLNMSSDHVEIFLKPDIDRENSPQIILSPGFGVAILN